MDEDAYGIQKGNSFHGRRFVIFLAANYLNSIAQYPDMLFFDS